MVLNSHHEVSQSRSNPVAVGEASIRNVTIACLSAMKALELERKYAQYAEYIDSTTGNKGVFLGIFCIYVIGISLAPVQTTLPVWGTLPT
jgi:hypothetical protein